jgi:hypothetical protein
MYKKHIAIYKRWLYYEISVHVHIVNGKQAAPRCVESADV